MVLATSGPPENIQGTYEVLRKQHMDVLAAPTPNMVIPTHNHSVHNDAYVRIVEQPAQRALRFRYECEGRSAGSIPGCSTTVQTKTHPTIQVMNYRGPAVVVVSLVTKDGPHYRPHPHNLVGREGCKKGVCTMMINSPDMTASFTSLGIQCVKRKEVEDSLRKREAIKVDPFRTGFAHRSQASTIDLNVVRLCFQVFIEGPECGRCTVQLEPIVSDMIYDKKALSDLVIMKLSHHSAPASGGTEVILLCERVTKDDIQVRFFEEHGGQAIWEGFGEFQMNDVHKHFAIAFRTPRYRDETIQQPAQVYVQLRRASDDTVSDPRPFQFTPVGDPEGLRHKRQKIEDGCLDRYLRNPIPTLGALGGIEDPRISRNVKYPSRMRIKTEPGSSAMADHHFQAMGMPGLVPFSMSQATALPGDMQMQFRSPGNNVHEILEMASSQVCSSSATRGKIVATSLDETVEKLDSLDLGLTADKLDSLDLGINADEMNELMGGHSVDVNLSAMNLSASIFDSGNLVPAPSLIADEQQNDMISNLQNEISTLRQMCGSSSSSSGNIPTSQGMT